MGLCRFHEDGAFRSWDSCSGERKAILSGSSSRESSFRADPGAGRDRSIAPPPLSPSARPCQGPCTEPTNRSRESGCTFLEGERRVGWTCLPLPAASSPSSPCVVSMSGVLFQTRQAALARCGPTRNNSPSAIRSWHRRQHFVPLICLLNSFLSDLYVTKQESRHCLLQAPLPAHRRAILTPCRDFDRV